MRSQRESSIYIFNHIEVELRACFGFLCFQLVFHVLFYQSLETIHLPFPCLPIIQSYLMIFNGPEAGSSRWHWPFFFFFSFSVVKSSLIYYMLYTKIHRKSSVSIIPYLEEVKKKKTIVDAPLKITISSSRRPKLPIYRVRKGCKTHSMVNGNSFTFSKRSMMLLLT